MINGPYKTLPDNSKFDLFAPDPSLLTIDYIAEVLSNINRFGGDVKYSVAQHALNCRKYIQYYHPYGYDIQLAALCHDNTEAIIGDHITPQKQFTYMKDCMGRYVSLDEIEERLATRMNEHFNIPSGDNIDLLVKMADTALAAGESSFLLPNRAFTPSMAYLPIPSSCDFSQWEPQKAKIVFIRTYQKLQRLINEQQTKKANRKNSRA